MMNTLASWLHLTPGAALVLVIGVFLASIIRGFSGFALTATMMAIGTLVLAPVELLSICLMLEIVAGLFMIRSGLKEADFKLIFTMLAAALFGIPLGLSLTTSISPDLSRILSQTIILVLAAAQLFNVRPAWLAGRNGRLAAGFVSGLATGIAGLGGMVVALFVLAQNLPPRKMRGSVVAYLFVGLVLSGGFQYAYGVMTPEAVSRGLILAPLGLLGILIGQQLFRPGFESAYRSICLTLLLVLASVGIIKTAL